jgi:hypothetical protein
LFSVVAKLNGLIDASSTHLKKVQNDAEGLHLFFTVLLSLNAELSIADALVLLPRSVQKTFFDDSTTVLETKFI